MSTHSPLFLAPAIVGYFNPDKLLKSVADSSGETQNKPEIELISELAVLCDEVSIKGSVFWRMKSDERNERLVVSAKDQKKPVLLLAQCVLEPHDVFGEAIIRGLRKQDLSNLEKNILDNPTELLFALKLLRDTFFQLNNEEQVRRLDSTRHRVRRKIGRQVDQRCLQTAIPKQLFGRDEEYNTLLAYLRSDKGSKLSVFTITGIGGQGKSALVSLFVYKQRKRPNFPPAIYLDFDRASLEGGDPILLTREFTRQLLQFDPSLEKSLLSFNNKAKRLRGSTARHFDIRRNEAFELVSELRPALQGWQFLESRVLIVLDTFEEVIVRGSITSTIFQWLQDLRLHVGISNLAVVISGRILSLDILESNGIDVWRSLELADLPCQARKDLLVSKGLTMPVADRASKSLGGNPLLLNMFARFSIENGTKVDEVLEEAESFEPGRPYTQLSVDFIYTRILNRIRDPILRELACSSLLLRRITPKILQLVLAESCKLSSISEEEAESLFDKLETSLWSNQSESSKVKVIEHRRDLRRFMLPGVTASNVELAEEIHRKMALFYRTGKSDLSGFESNIESLYHRGFLQDVSDLDYSEARLLIDRLGEDFQDWPVESRAIVRSIAADMSLSKAELNALPAEQLNVMKNMLIGNALKHGDQVSVDSIMDEEVEVTTLFGFSACFQELKIDKIESRVPFIMDQLWNSIAADKVDIWSDIELGYSLGWQAVCTNLLSHNNDSLFSEKTLEENFGKKGSTTATNALCALSFACVNDDKIAVQWIKNYVELPHIARDFPRVLRTEGQIQVVRALINHEETKDLGRSLPIHTIRGADLFRLTEVNELTRVFGIQENSLRSVAKIELNLGLDTTELSYNSLLSISNELNKVELSVDSLGSILETDTSVRQLHAPIRYMLSQLSSEEFLETVSYLENRFALWPTDFTTARIAADTQSISSVLSQMVLTADHLGYLGELLWKVHQLNQEKDIRWNQLRSVFDKLNYCYNSSFQLSFQGGIGTELKNLPQEQKQILRRFFTQILDMGRGVGFELTVQRWRGLVVKMDSKVSQLNYEGFEIVCIREKPGKFKVASVRNTQSGS